MSSTYLVTGANRGLGLEFVRQLKARGERVFATARTPRDAADLRALTPDVLALDVSSESSIQSLAAALKGQAIDVLINNAGVFGNDPGLNEITMGEFQRVFAANTFGPALLVKALVKNVEAGRKRQVFTISSTLGSITHSSHGFSWSYRSSKAAVNMLTAAMHNELSPRGFTCVTFCPGWNKTDMGGKDAPLEPKDSIRSLIGVMDRIVPADSGRFLSHEGNAIAW
ncbi:MAG: SDR family oxidoreductase [Planctomycetes bacterium]|nr:SDR family oxidoreductase [Planctomycetota bacterium]